MDNGTELGKPHYAIPENLIDVDEHLSKLKAEAEKLGSSFPLCSELLARGMWKLSVYYLLI